MSYYRKFIASYASIAAPLVKETLDKAPNKVVWTAELGASFNLLCKSLCDSCQLHIPSPQDLFVVLTDASYSGLGACLSIICGGSELLVAFNSRQLRDAETRYLVMEIECLAAVEDIQNFEVHLDGRRF